MAERRSFDLGPRLDFQQLMIEAQHRWLRPAEICEILHNFQNFQITPEPPTRPPSGSLFLFDRKVLRYFRKDGHNWRKKKDGKTVREAHEKLKVGSVDVLHCYYAHGEENENFQRRSYWLLEPDYMNIVFVHYLEVKGNKTNLAGIRATTENISGFDDSQSSSGLIAGYSKTNSGNTVSSPASTLTSLCEDADSGDIRHGKSPLQPFLQVSPTRNGPYVDSIASNISTSHLLNPTSGNHHEGQPSVAGVSNLPHGQANRHVGDAEYTWMNEYQRSHHTPSDGDGWQQYTTEKFSYGENAVDLASGSLIPDQSNLQATFEDNAFQLSNWPADQTLNSGITYDLGPGLFEQRTHASTLQIAPEAFYASDQQSEHSVPGLAESQWGNSNSGNGFPVEGISNYVFPPRKLLLDGEEKMQKVDSFSKWITKELGDVGDLHVQSTSDIPWSAVECGNINYESSLSPSLSQDQLFSIIDFSPKWAYPDSDTEVFITGTFLKRQPQVTNFEWSCMFGELEVSAEVLADGVLCCHVPTHGVGIVPFYITCSNRVACSEVREFEYQEGSSEDVNVTDIYSSDGSELLICFRLEKLLSLKSVGPWKNAFEGDMKMRDLITKLMSLKEEENNYQTLEPRLENGFPVHDLKAQSFLRLTKEKFFSWLLHKVTEDGKGPSVLDDEGQGVVHLVAALGYDWAIKPIVAAGVSINFRDVNGWTALHWAAFCGRERTVAVLLSLGADPGLLTDPSPDHPLGRTAADLASGNGHKGISGFLAETNLTGFLAKLSMEDPNENDPSEVPGTKAVLTVAEKAATPVSAGDVPEVLSLRDSLNAVCNAKQAADRIHLVFRMQSFRRKQVVDEYGSTDERAISILAPKTRKPGQNNGLVHAAATQIQKKFRGWKKRKEFLIIRQRIIKIQAHVRGHQVRKQYKTIIWSVGILEKIILRWRRKGSGLRGFRQDIKEPNPQDIISKDDDYDFLKEGRKHTEERLEKALTRVKSMVQYPEARDQYRRLLTVVEGIRETKGCDMVFNSSEDVPDGEDDMIDIEPLLDDEAFMSMAFE